MLSSKNQYPSDQVCKNDSNCDNSVFLKDIHGARDVWHVHIVHKISMKIYFGKLQTASEFLSIEHDIADRLSG